MPPSLIRFQLRTCLSPQPHLSPNYRNHSRFKRARYSNTYSSSAMYAMMEAISPRRIIELVVEKKNLTFPATLLGELEEPSSFVEANIWKAFQQNLADNCNDFSFPSIANLALTFGIVVTREFPRFRCSLSCLQTLCVLATRTRYECQIYRRP
jgi:hypothetical protein